MRSLLFITTSCIVLLLCSFMYLDNALINEPIRLASLEIAPFHVLLLLFSLVSLLYALLFYRSSIFCHREYSLSKRCDLINLCTVLSTAIVWCGISIIIVDYPENRGDMHAYDSDGALMIGIGNLLSIMFSLRGSFTIHSRS